MGACGQLCLWRVFVRLFVRMRVGACVRVRSWRTLHVFQGTDSDLDVDLHSLQSIELDTDWEHDGTDV